jgi:hypothetical protein
MVDQNRKNSARLRMMRHAGIPVTTKKKDRVKSMNGDLFSNFREFYREMEQMNKGKKVWKP